jgi:hypothetical protein
MKRYSLQQGLGIIEVIIGAAIISTGLLALTNAYSDYVRFALLNQKNIQAAYLAEEGAEVITFFRDMGWVNITAMSTTTTQYIRWTGTTWATSTTPQYVGEFLREIAIQDVFRDGSNKISTAGTYEPNVREIVVNVQYPTTNGTSTKSITTFITNIYK